MSKCVYFPVDDKADELYAKCCKIQSSLTQAEIDSIYAMSDFIAATAQHISNDLKTLYIRKDKVKDLRLHYMNISEDLNAVCKLLGYQQHPTCKTVFRSEEDG